MGKVGRFGYLVGVQILCYNSVDQWHNCLIDTLPKESQSPILPTLAETFQIRGEIRPETNDPVDVNLS